MERLRARGETRPAAAGAPRLGEPPGLRADSPDPPQGLRSEGRARAAEEDLPEAPGRGRQAGPRGVGGVRVSGRLRDPRGRAGTLPAVAPLGRASELPGPAALRPRPVARPSGRPQRALAALHAGPRGRVPGHRPDPGRDPFLSDRLGHRREGLEGARAAPGLPLRCGRPQAVHLPLPPRGHPDLRRRALAHRGMRAGPPSLDELPLDPGGVRLGQPRLRPTRVLSEGGGRGAGRLCAPRHDESGEPVRARGLPHGDSGLPRRRRARRADRGLEDRGFHRRLDCWRRTAARGFSAPFSPAQVHAGIRPGAREPRHRLRAWRRKGLRRLGGAGCAHARPRGARRSRQPGSAAGRAARPALRH